MRPRRAFAAVLAALIIGGAGGLGGIWVVDRVLERARAPHEVVVASPPLRFEVPHDWHAADRHGDPADEWVKQSAALQRLTPEDYLAGLEATVVATEVGPASGGRGQSLDVQRTTFAALPTREQVTQQLAGQGMRVDDVRSVTTPAGPVVVSRTTLVLPVGSVSMELLHVVSAGHVVVITISAVDGGDVELVTSGVLATLRTS